MKVVLFCGGMGMRMRDYSDRVPKPLVPLGRRPMVWHIMRFYAHFGHHDFVLALGYGADQIKRYFMDYQEWESNDFVLSDGGSRVELLGRDLDDWRITFVDTGMHASVGERLYALRPHLDDEEVFLANYADCLTDADPGMVVAKRAATGAAAAILAVRPKRSFHVVELDEGGLVTHVGESTDSAFRINGGYMALTPEVFDFMRPGEELVEQPFERMIRAGRLAAVPYEGEWAAVDTFKDRQELDESALNQRGFWEVWR